MLGVLNARKFLVGDHEPKKYRGTGINRELVMAVEASRQMEGSLIHSLSGQHSTSGHCIHPSEHQVGVGKSGTFPL